MKESSHVFLQLDGNDTLGSDLESSTDTVDAPINTLDDDQCQDEFSAIPKVYSANARSLFPKYNDLIEKLVNNRIDVVQISETWQDVKKDDHNDKIDELENKYGYKFYSYARAKYRDDGSLTGGGGSALLVNQRNFSSCIIKEIIVPAKLEVVWVKVFPKIKNQVNTFIFCSIYSKPNSKTKTLLNDHIATNYHLLKMKHEAIKFFLLGDFNDHKPDVLLQLSPQLRQIVHYPTCGQKVLDLCITDAHTLYHPPLLESPLQPDDPSSASPSDHAGIILLPRSNLPGVVPKRAKKLIKVRPITKSQMIAIGSSLVREDWTNILSINDTDSKLEMFTNTVFALLDKVAPIKEVKISCDDPAWMNSRIKTI